MRPHCLSILSLLIAFTPPTLVAQSSQDQQRFAGTWEARFKDAVICTLRLQAGDTLTGATSGCSIHVNSDGDLIETEAADGMDESPISNVRLEGDQLAFAIKDGDDEMKLELTLTGERRAELRFVDAPVKIKPVRFEKR